MKTALLAAAGLALSALIAAPASAAVTVSFLPGPAHSPTPGFTVLDDFNSPSSLTGWTTTGTVLLLNPPPNSSGAPPANSSPAGTQYMSVLANSDATWTFASPVFAVEFDWGSVDSYNTLTIHTTSGDIVNGGSAFVSPANGNQSSNLTNGLLVASGGGITGVSITDGAFNSFEIDNFAVNPVPEPATWALMILGFGGIGYLLRRRRDHGLMQTA